MGESVRVLLVDDEKNILETFSHLLADRGFYIKAASDADTALRLVNEDSFHVAFLDQYLGDTTGLELMQRLAEADPGLYFVIITASGSTELAVDALKGGASDFISKPFFAGDLVKSIRYVDMKRRLDLQKKQMVFSLERKMSEKSAELEGIYLSVLSSLAQAMEKKDIGTYGHSRRVSYYSRIIAASMDLNEAQRAELKAAALLHDIGKIGISDFILGKNGPLSDNERDTVLSHPQKGVEILSPLKQFKSILPAILHHHENYDGTGYPHGIAGTDIPLFSRIIAVADTYDAILSNRPYRSASSHDEALAEIADWSGKQFDPAVVASFLHANAKYRNLFAGSYQSHGISEPSNPSS